jgi:hypothetical protein
MVSSGLGAISFQEHDGAGAAAIIDRLVWIWAQQCPDGDVGLRRRLAVRHTGCNGFRCFTASSEDVIIGYAYGMYEGQGTGLGEPGKVISLGSHDLLASAIQR